MRLRVHYGSDDLQVSPRIYEWAAIVTARHWTANHPWNSHSPAAIREGVSPEAVKSLAEGRRPVDMAEDEELAYDFLHELWENQHITDATYDRAVDMFGRRGSSSSFRSRRCMEPLGRLTPSSMRRNGSMSSHPSPIASIRPPQCRPIGSRVLSAGAERYRLDFRRPRVSPLPASCSCWWRARLGSSRPERGSPPMS